MLALEDFTPSLSVYSLALNPMGVSANMLFVNRDNCIYQILLELRRIDEQTTANIGLFGLSGTLLST